MSLPRSDQSGHSDISLGTAFHRLGSPPSVYRLATQLTPWFAWAAVACFGIGLYGALVAAPPDYQQGHACRVAVNGGLCRVCHRRRCRSHLAY